MPHRILLPAPASPATSAFWLARHGHDVTVVERAPEFRDGGQNVDVRDKGREVLERMGLDAVALARGTGEQGTAWVGEDGRVNARFAPDASQGDGKTRDGMTAEMEILRGDLARLIWEAARDEAAFRFGAMRPMVETAQAIPKLIPRLMHPQTRLGIGLLHGALKLASRPAGQAVVARFAGGKRGGAELKDYGSHPLVVNRSVSPALTPVKADQGRGRNMVRPHPTSSQVELGRGAKGALMSSAMSARASKAT